MLELDYETTLSPEILQKAKDELGEDEFLRYESVTALREWIKKQPHLQNAPTGIPLHKRLLLQSDILLYYRRTDSVELFERVQI